MISLKNVSHFFFRAKQIPGSSIQDLQIVSREKITALRDVNLEIKAGERVFITGPNGSGKSTLLKIISGMITPSRGEVVVLKTPGSLLALPEGSCQNLSLRDFLFKLKLNPGKAREALLFSGLDSLADIPVAELSLGMRVRLLASHLIFSDHEALLLDDIFFVSDKEFQEKFLEEAKGRTVVLAHHDKELLNKLAGRKIILYNGAINEE